MGNELDEVERRVLEKSIRRRDLLVRSIQRACTNIENLEITGDDSSLLGTAKIDREDLDRKLAEFHEIQLQIKMDVDDKDLDAHENERTRVETIARSAKIVLADYIAANGEITGSNTSQRRSTSAETKPERKLKRPEIQIPKFEGDYKKWNDFRNVFESVVVNDSAYSNVEKMVYLKQAMQKGAADVIRKFEITEQNFEKAWEKLKKRYENRRATINNHLQSLTQLPQAKTEAGLQKLWDAAADAIESLDAMGVKDGWSHMISYLVTEKLDSETRKAWEVETVREIEYPKYELLDTFLQQRIRVIESMGGTASKAPGVAATAKKTETTAKSFAARKSTESSDGERRCFNCQENHAIAECGAFAEKSLAEKTELIKRRGLCFQCLCKGHMVIACRAPRCAECSKRHHILLHVEGEKPSANSIAKPSEKVEIKKSFCVRADNSRVLLPAALVKACRGSKKLVIRTFLDSCSEINFITERLAKWLKCRKLNSEIVVKTAMPGALSISKHCRVKVESRNRDYSVEIDFQIIPQIADDFNPYSTNVKNLNIELADSPLRCGSHGDMLIGAEYYEALMLPGRIKQADGPYLRETQFGWVAIGTAQSQALIESARYYLTIQDQLQQFFVLEEVVSATVTCTAEERKCDEHFEAHFLLDKIGFEVFLPKGLPVEFLGESRHIAFRQFCALEKRLTAEEFVVYKGFMDEYIYLGHMTLVEKPELVLFRCFLPHHAVYKKSSTTTRMHLVFNASCPTSTGYSLNDILMKGPVLQEDLFTILVRFRCYSVAFTADIEKMYRQVRVAKEDRCLQCILWRDKPSEPIRTYELNTVTYGTKPASYLATKCLRKLAEKCESEYPETATILRSDFYMDDVLTGGNSVQEVRESCGRS